MEIDFNSNESLVGGENVFFCGLGMCLVSTVISGPPTKKMVLSLILIISHNEDHEVDDNVYDSSYNDDENSDDSGDDQRLTFRFRNFSVSRLLPIF